MRNGREFVLRVILPDTMLGWAQTENDIFNLLVMMIMLLCYQFTITARARIIGHVTQQPWTHVVTCTAGQGMGHRDKS